MSKSCSDSNKKKPELRRETAGSTVSRAELEVLRQKAVDLSVQMPEKAAVILADWLNRPAGRVISRAASKKTG